MLFFEDHEAPVGNLINIIIKDSISEKQKQPDL